MNSEIEKQAQLLYDNINFKDRNTTSPYTLHDEIAKHQNKYVDRIALRSKWLEAQKRKAIYMNTNGYSVLQNQAYRSMQ